MSLPTVIGEINTWKREVERSVEKFCIGAGGVFWADMIPTSEQINSSNPF
jgi:hypothetical protein